MKRPQKRYIFAKTLACICVLGVLVMVGYGILHRTPAKEHVTNTQFVKNESRNPSSTKPVVHTDVQLQAVVDHWADTQSFDTAVVVRELDGNLRTAEHAASTQLTTASTYKLYVAYATLHEVEQGKYTMQTVTRSGQTIATALNKMILQSDNTSAEALGFLVGWDRVNNLAASLGATSTDINNYNSAGQAVNGSKVSTAADLAVIVGKLQQGALLNSANTKLLLDLMKTQVWRQRIPAGVPGGIVVADKPGWLSDVQNDAAIVYGPKSTYVLVIMTAGNSTKALADLSAQVYDYLQK